ncbi:FliM/FliN family flagellar motor C-terminal domain-containing protein [Massilia sp. S19_KUP03_FR1]|uniref:FliM/FliN family flagellar motor C-terminal domain-containing protein n=1 Tax=Massilia sp. S19_KUP03_FR1 TaxID=3025503 RepID=UPI002FCDB92B
MNVTPYSLLKRSRATLLARRMLANLEHWGADWAMLPDHAATCADACEAAPVTRAGAWRRRMLADGTALFVAWPEQADAWIEQQVFGLEDGAARSPLAGAVAAIAREALLAYLTEALCGQAAEPMDPAPPPAALWQRGAGSVLGTVQLGTLTVHVLVPATAMQPAPAPAPSGLALVPLRTALAAREVALTVELCRAELTLGYLATLALGDVLALPMRLTTPLQLRGPGGTALCAAHLGAQDGQRAVELTRPPGGVPAANEPRNRT